MWAGSAWQQKPSLDAWLLTAIVTIARTRPTLEAVSKVRAVRSLFWTSLGAMLLPIPMAFVAVLMVRGMSDMGAVVSLSAHVAAATTFFSLFALVVTHSCSFFGSTDRRLFAAAAGAHGLAAVALLCNVGVLAATSATLIPIVPLRIACGVLTAWVALFTFLWLFVFVAAAWRRPDASSAGTET
jgi:hypothetical protein